MKISDLNLGKILTKEQAKQVKGGNIGFDVYTYCPVGAACGTSSGAWFGAGDRPSGGGVVGIVSGICACIEGTTLSYVPPTNMC